MKFLMLRGQVPTDRDPNEIVFDTIEAVDDVWTQLFHAMIGTYDQGELWYWGGNRAYKFSDNFTERWVPDFKTYKTDFVPDVIFCRGGFKEYHSVLNRFNNTVKIYYGAGRRFLPQPGFTKYDIILQDSPEQVDICKNKFPESYTTLYIKPAADNIFFPHDVEKKYDVCFPANGSQSFKGHDFVYKTVPKDLNILNLGNAYKVNPPSNVTSYRVLRTEMAKNISMCKVGIVCVNSAIDSCPRVLPELLACGLPVVVLHGVRFWAYKYIKSGITGELSTMDMFWDVVKDVLSNIDRYNPYTYYSSNLSIKSAATDLLMKILLYTQRR